MNLFIHIILIDYFYKADSIKAAFYKKAQHASVSRHLHATSLFNPKEAKCAKTV
jgi:hypothetical protein